MRPPVGSGLRRATGEDLRRVLGAAPAQPWHGEDAPAEGLAFDLAHDVDFEAIGDLGGKRRVPGPAGRQRSTTRVVIAGPFTRMDWSSSGEGEPDTAIVLHPDRGALFLDLAGGTHLHLGPEQVPRAANPDADQHGGVTWRVHEGKPGTLDGRPTRSLVVEGSGALRVRWELDVVDDPALRPYAARVLELVLGAPELVRGAGFPLGEVAESGFPVRARTTALAVRGCDVDAGGVTVANPGVRPVSPGDVVPSVGSVDLRGRRRPPKSDASPVVSLAPAGARPRPGGATPGRSGATAPASGHAAAAAPAPSLATPALPGLDGKPTFTDDGAVILPGGPSEVPLSACLPSTERVGSALEIRQLLLDHVAFAANAVTRRIRTVEGSHTDQANGEVRVDLDWLGQLAADNQHVIDEGGDGDGLFCILRDPPPPEDPTAGGTGLLDRLAAVQAARLMATDDPLADDGAHGPLDVPQEVADAVRRVVQDTTIARDDRFDALSARSRAQFREAVLTERIGVLATSFDGDSGLQRLPRDDWDLLHVRFQVERLHVDLAETTVEDLSIRDDSGQVIRLGLHVAGLTGVFSQTREPGDDFWIDAAGALIVAGLILPTAAGVILGLAVLGAPGLLVVAGLLEGLATPIGLILLAVTTFLLWEDATITARIGEFRVRSELSWAFAADRSSLSLQVGPLSLDGELTIVSYDSHIPSGIHQVLGWITGALVNLFDLARTGVEHALGQVITGAVAGLPHLLLPTPQDVAIDGDPVLQYRAAGGATDGADHARMAVQLLADVAVAPRNAGLLLTQVEPNPLPTLRSVVDGFEGKGPAYLGYGFSQNLLNAWAYATWAGGTFDQALSSSETGDLIARLGTLGDECADAKDRAAHVWPATPPRILVTPYAAWTGADRPYLLGVFDDLRLCIGCGGSSLEVRFGARVLAHIGLGRVPPDGDALSLLTESTQFGDVYFDTCPDSIAIDPRDVQSIAASPDAMSGTGPFAAFADLDAAGRAAALDGVAGMLPTVVIRALRRRRASLVPFATPDGPVDRQLYDGFIVAQLTPVRSGVYMALGPLDAFRPILPASDGTGPLIDITDMSCGEALRALRNLRTP